MYIMVIEAAPCMYNVEHSLSKLAVSHSMRLSFHFFSALSFNVEL